MARQFVSGTHEGVDRCRGNPMNENVIHHFEDGESIGGRIGFEDSEAKRNKVQQTLEYLRRQSSECRQKHPDAVSQIEKYIDSVDVFILRDIFAEYLKKLGIQEERINFVHPDSIFIVEKESLQYEGQSALMCYNPATNAILINVDIASRINAKNDTNRSTPIEFLRLLFHEYTHGASGNTVTTEQIADDKNTPSFEINSQTGISESKINSKDFEQHVETIFEILNEAITDLIADEVSLEYGDRVKNEEITRGMVRKYLLGNSLYGAYSQERSLTLGVIKEIADAGGVPEEVVWRGLVRQYFRGESLLDPELMMLLHEVFSAEFLNDLRSKKPGMEFPNLDEFFKKHVSAIIRWLERLESVEGAK
jgi:hypothetical protein